MESYSSVVSVSICVMTRVVVTDKGDIGTTLFVDAILSTHTITNSWGDKNFNVCN